MNLEQNAGDEYNPLPTFIGRENLINREMRTLKHLVSFS